MFLYITIARAVIKFGSRCNISSVPCKGRPKGPQPLGRGVWGHGGMLPQKFLKLDPLKYIFLHSKVQILYFLNQKVKTGQKDKLDNE